MGCADKFLALSSRARWGLGCCASKKAVDPGPPPHLQSATARKVRLLESVAAKEERVEQPVLRNSERRRCGRRGVTQLHFASGRWIYPPHTEEEESSSPHTTDSPTTHFTPRLGRAAASAAGAQPPGAGDGAGRGGAGGGGGGGGGRGG